MKEIFVRPLIKHKMKRLEERHEPDMNGLFNVEQFISDKIT